MLAHDEGLRPTQHYQSRAAGRALRSDVEAFLMTWGTETRANGATHITLLRCHLPPELRDTEEAARAEGWILILDQGSLVTCYRRTNAWHFVRRKSHQRPRRRSRRY